MSALLRAFLMLSLTACAAHTSNGMGPHCELPLDPSAKYPFFASGFSGEQPAVSLNELARAAFGVDATAQRALIPDYYGEPTKPAVCAGSTYTVYLENRTVTYHLEDTNDSGQIVITLTDDLTPDVTETLAFEI